MSQLSRYEQLQVDLEDKGILTSEISETALAAVSVPISKELCAIGINPHTLKTDAEKMDALLHEGGHCESGAFYSRYTPRFTIRQLERKADKFVAENYITKEMLDEAHEKHGLSEVWEFAEHFEVTVGYMKRIFHILFNSEFMDD